MPFFLTGPSGNHAHLYSRVLEHEGIHMKCRFTNDNVVNATSIFDGDAPRMLLHRCPVENLQNRLALKVELWRDTNLVATVDPRMSIEAMPELPPTISGMVHICLSPSFANFDTATLLEWRIHHSRIGIKTVHWYHRPETSHLLPIVQDMNNILGTRDTIRLAPYLVEEPVRNASQLHKHGAYADQVSSSMHRAQPTALGISYSYFCLAISYIVQVPYHMDCIARVGATEPAPWVATIDADEYILPEPFDKNAAHAVDKFVAHSKNKTASLCLGRTGFRGPAILGEQELESLPPPGTSAWRLLYLGSFKPYQSVRSEYNIKCFHKSDAVELVFTHWPERFMPNQPRKEVVWLEKHHPGVPRIAHLREVDRYMSPFSFPNKITPQLKDWVRSLAVEVQAVLERMSSQATPTIL